MAGDEDLKESKFVRCASRAYNERSNISHILLMTGDSECWMKRWLDISLSILLDLYAHRSLFL